MNCPKCRKSHTVIKVGVRKLSKGPVQKYFCRSCGRYFSSTIHPFSLYPDEVIIRSIDLYNRGNNILRIISRIYDEHSIKIPERTIYSWLDRYHRRYNLYLLDKGRRDVNRDPIRSVGFHNNVGSDIVYHRSKVASNTCKDHFILDFLDNLDPDFDVERARSHPNSRMGFEKGDPSISDSIRVHTYLMDLFMRINRDDDLNGLKEFFLVNHPNTIMTDTPFNLDPYVSPGNTRSDERIDILARDGSGFEIIDMANENVPISDRIEELIPFVNIFKKSTRQQKMKLTLLHPSQIRTFTV